MKLFENCESGMKCYKCNRKIATGIIIFSSKDRTICKSCLEKLNNENENKETDDDQDILPGSFIKDDLEGMDIFEDDLGLCFDDDDDDDDEGSAKEKNEEKPKEKAPKVPSPAEIVKLLDEYVMGQEAAKKSISVALFNHLMRTGSDEDKEDELPKSNILLCGPTGSGKTEIFRTISKLFDIPLAIGDATTLTSAGYKGDDIESLLTGLLAQTGGDVSKAEKGIVYIDEFDKICGITDTKQDGYNKTLQQNLLKMIEGKIADVPANGIEKTKSNTVKMDTSNILFVCGGAFTGIRASEEEEEGFKGSIGFVKNEQDKFNSPKKTGNRRKLIPQDFIRFGVIQEMAGRLPIIVELNELTEKDLKTILVKPKKSVYRKYKCLFERMGIELSITDGAMNVVVNKAAELKIGARALNTVMENLMEQMVYDASTLAKKGKLVITKRMAENFFGNEIPGQNGLSA